MDLAISTDGTPIAHTTTGGGPLLVVVGGALADHAHYAPLAAELASAFRVRTYDRRGRGTSGDTRPYAVEREVEDLAAVIGGEDVLVYGHSAGAALALRAAADGVAMRGLVLADLPYELPGEEARSRHAAEAARVRALGDPRERAAFFLEGMGVPAAEVGAFLTPAVLDCARALPYEYAVLGDGCVPTAETVRVSTVVLAATANAEPSRALVRSMPNARLVTLRGAVHEMTPAETAALLLPLLNAPGDQAQFV